MSTMVSFAIDALEEIYLREGGYSNELSEKRSPDAAAEIEAQLRRFGKPGTYYSARHGPMVRELEGPTPILNISKTLRNMARVLDASVTITTFRSGITCVEIVALSLAMPGAAS